MKKLIKNYSLVTANAAARAYLKIEELHGAYQGNPPKEITNSWKE